MSARVDISVNLCTYNRKEMLIQTLKSLIQQETDGRFTFEIIVVDDASTDGTQEVVKIFCKETIIPIKYIKEEGKGEANSRNRAVRESQGKWIALIDDDEIAEPCWLKEMVSTATSHNADCVGGRMRLLLPDDSDAKIIGTVRKLLGETSIPKKHTYNGPGGGNALINKKIFDEIGGFDISMIYGGTDQDFFRRARKKGYSFVHATNAVVFHIIPSNRLKPNYLRLTGRRCGKDVAYFDLREKGVITVLYICALRLTHALAITIPWLIYAHLICNEAEIMSRKCSLWFAVAYFRQTLFMLFPTLFPQKTFFDSLANQSFRDITSQYD